MRLARTENMELVEQIMRHPAIWPHVHDDGVDDAWKPTDHPGLFWMLLSDTAGPVGVFLVHALNSFCYEMHTCILPRGWGAQAAVGAQLLLTWAFTETECRKMVTHVPSYNRVARRFAVSGGMHVEGNNRQSFMRNGEMIDQIALGITKQEWLCQQQSLSPQP